MSNLHVATRRVKFWWHLSIAYIIRYQLRLIVSLSIIILSLYVFYMLAPNILRNNIVTIGFIGSYKIEDIPTEALTLATQSLIKADESGKSLPSLASNWTVSEDGKTYIVFLRDNITWHDGSQVEAKDISLAISTVEIRAVNNKTIQFTLPNPISSFPLALDTPVFKSKSFYGTGQFRIVDIAQTNQIVKKVLLHPKDDSLPRVEIRFYPSDQQAVNALKIGEIKVLASSHLNSLSSWKNINIKKTPEKTEIVTVFFNNTNDLLTSKEVRQALAYAIKKDDFEGELANGPISSSSWAYNQSTKKYEYNTSRAKELLSGAQLKNPKLSLSYSPDLKDLAQRIKDDWEVVGIKVDLKEEKGLPKDFQAFLVVNKLPKDPDQYALWHSTQSNSNIAKYKNVKIDKLLEDARIAKSDEERKQFYIDFQKYLTEDAPAIFLYHPYKYQAIYKNIQSFYDKLHI